MNDDYLRRLLRVPGGGVSVRGLLALAFDNASDDDKIYAEKLMRSNGWSPEQDAQNERDIHGLCPGDPIAEHPAATCLVCNMSRVTLDRLVALLRTASHLEEK